MVQSNTITVTVTEVLSKIVLTASATNIETGQGVTFKATAYDNLGNPMPNAKLTLLEESTNSSETATTDSSGVATFPLFVFDSAGQYTFSAS